MINYSTATDLNKANIVLKTIVCMFSVYCKEKFTQVFLINDIDVNQLKLFTWILTSLQLHRIYQHER